MHVAALPFLRMQRVVEARVRQPFSHDALAARGLHATVNYTRRHRVV